ncbi:MAG: hypothetical protein AAFQ23_12870, partial [Cyanobacteria bacterium J06623_1]
CSLNSLGSFSTLSTNCIEVSGDTPVDTFTDVREVVTPVTELFDQETIVLPPEAVPETPAAPPAPVAPPAPPAPAPPPAPDPDLF